VKEHPSACKPPLAKEWLQPPIDKVNLAIGLTAHCGRRFVDTKSSIPTTTLDGHSPTDARVSECNHRLCVERSSRLAWTPNSGNVWANAVDCLSQEQIFVVSAYCDRNCSTIHVVPDILILVESEDDRLSAHLKLGVDL
jgi:hypothetical protein